MDFNPYVYARNNPYRYIDRNGEFPWLIAAFALIGGGVNVWSNWDNINNAGDFIGFFATGAVSSALMSWVGVPAGFIQGFVTGAALGVASNVIQGSLNELVMGVPFNIDSKSMLIQAGISGVAGGIAGGIQARLNNKNFWTGKKITPSKTNIDAIYPLDNIQELPNNYNNITNQTNPHEVLSQSLADSQQPIGQGTSSVYVGYDETVVIKYVGRTDRIPLKRFAEHLNSGGAVSKLKFEPITNTLNHQGSRIIEQQLINTYGLEKNGGQLFNRINSISPKYWNKYGISPKK